MANPDRQQLQANTDARADQRALWMLSVAYWVACAILLELQLVVPDGVGYYVYAQSLVTHWDLSIVSGLQTLGAWDFFAITPTGHAANVFAFGTAILWLPFVAVAHWLSMFASVLGVPVPSNGVGSQYVFSIAFATAFYGYLTLCLSYRCARIVAPASESLAAVIAIGSTTPFLYYAFFAGSCSHVPAAFCVAFLLYWRVAVVPASSGELGHCIVLGVSAGVCALVRWELSLLGVVIAVEYALDALRQRRAWMLLSVFSATMALSFAPQSVVWWLQFGRPVTVPQGAGFLNLWQPKIAALLFSSHHGLFSWAPVLIPAAGGLFMAPARQSSARLTWLLLAMLLPQIYVCACVADVSAGASFGARRLVPMTPIFVIGLAAALRTFPRGWSGALLAACALWTTLLLLAFKWQILAPAYFATWPQVLSAVAEAIHHVPVHAVGWRMESLKLVSDALVLPRAALPMFAAVGIATALCILAIRWVTRSRMAKTQLLAICAIAASVLLLVGVGMAAHRSYPAVAPALIERDQALLDFRTYANSRSDSNPFRAVLKSMSRCPDLQGRVMWGPIPFEVARPAKEAQDTPSVLTNCGIGNSALSVVLPGTSARRLHLAIVAQSVAADSIAAELEVALSDGRVLRKKIVVGRDVVDVLAASPVERSVVTSLFTTIQGWSLPLQGDPTRLIIKQGRPPLACMAIIGVTLELANGEYRPINLTPFANANHGVDYFRVEPRVNYFPDLSPGRLNANGVSFLVSRPGLTITGGNTLTTGGIPGYRQLIPLQQKPSRDISLLIDGLELPTQGTVVATITVEYSHGDPSVHKLRAGVELNDYERPAVEPVAWRGRGFQDLTHHHITLDSHRTPRSLWLESAAGPSQHSPASVTIFAITQQLVSAK